MVNKKLNSRKKLLKAVKIAVGSSMAIFMAKTFHLDYAISAGTITLLTVVTTKWETIRLSLYSQSTPLLTILLAGVLFFHISNEWVAYGIFVFILVMV
ncbi:MAG: aromatic acid exporter family protein [Eubacteriales bacterium]|nr:aromatic acid exporter family protein [Eubacteriales bacterium]